MKKQSVENLSHRATTDGVSIVNSVVREGSTIEAAILLANASHVTLPFLTMIEVDNAELID